MSYIVCDKHGARPQRRWALPREPRQERGLQRASVEWMRRGGESFSRTEVEETSRLVRGPGQTDPSA